VSEGERELRWSEESRLRAIDATAFWEGRINRSDLIRRFGISVPQATNDFREYQARAPGNVRYDARQKAYLAEPGFQPLFGPPSAETWLSAGETGAAATVPVGRTPMPARSIDPWLLRQLLAALRERQALEVLYQPMDEADPSWRWLSPVALGSDGVRWHLRAYNHDRDRYEDFLFPRMLELGSTRTFGDLPADTDWERCVPVLLKPAARLSPGQCAVIEADYGMVDGVVRLEVRAALLALFLRRMGLDRADGLVDIANRAEVEAEAERVASRFR
jgi:hypothetical protein